MGLGSSRITIYRELNGRCTGLGNLPHNVLPPNSLRHGSTSATRAATPSMYEKKNKELTLHYDVEPVVGYGIWSPITNWRLVCAFSPPRLYLYPPSPVWLVAAPRPTPLEVLRPESILGIAWSPNSLFLYIITTPVEDPAPGLP